MNILVVDQSELFARLTRTLLEKWGHTVTVAADGDSALALLERDPYRIVILDFELKDCSGLDLCREIRKSNTANYTYVIFFTGQTSKDSMIEALEAGADEYITKPLNMSELKLRIGKGRRLLSLEDRSDELPGTNYGTGNLNAKAFRKLLRFAMADAKRASKTGALLYIDLLNYLEVRDEFGIHAAQKMVAEISRLVSDNIRESDLLGQKSDGTLCVLLQNTDADHCTPLLDKLGLLLRNLHIEAGADTFSPTFKFRPIDYLNIAGETDALLDSEWEQASNA